MAEEVWGCSPAGEDPNPEGFSLVRAVSAAVLVWPDFQGVLSRAGLPCGAPSYPEGSSPGAAPSAAPGRAEEGSWAEERAWLSPWSWASCAEGLPVEAVWGPLDLPQPVLAASHPGTHNVAVEHLPGSSARRKTFLTMTSYKLQNMYTQK